MVDTGVLAIGAKPGRRGLRIADLERLENRRNGTRIDNGSALGMTEKVTERDRRDRGNDRGSDRGSNGGSTEELRGEVREKVVV